jgi:hypothetical protein
MRCAPRRVAARVITSMLALLALLSATFMAPSGAGAQASVAAPSSGPLSATARDTLRRQLQSALGSADRANALASAGIVSGPRQVATNTTVEGDVLAVNGPLDVYGTVHGMAIAVGGDVNVHPGGHVTDNAISVGGQVRPLGGKIDGDIRSDNGALRSGREAAAGPQRSPFERTTDALKLTAGWLAITILIGVGVLVFAGDYLNGVAEAVERNPTRALWMGIVGQLLALPVLLLGSVGLAITIVGALLIPVAIVAWLAGLAGLVTLGFLGVALVTGRSFGRTNSSARLTERGSALRALILGVLAYLGLWLVAAALTPLPTVAFVLRLIAIAVTWVAATAGLGAALESRAGTRRTPDVPVAPPRRPSSPSSPPVPDWQTPTPITGVVAARRQTPASRSPDA